MRPAVVLLPLRVTARCGPRKEEAGRLAMWQVGVAAGAAQVESVRRGRVRTYLADFFPDKPRRKSKTRTAPAKDQQLATADNVVSLQAYRRHRIMPSSSSPAPAA